MDLIFTYSLSASGNLTELARTPTAKGFGPRHSVLHPEKDILFVIGEMGGAVASYAIGQNGTLKQISSASTLPESDPKTYGSKAAEIAITPNGRHLYASNRAFAANFTDTIAVFDISPKGELTSTQQVKCPAYPRGMTLMPNGKHLLVASQTNSEVASFEVNQTTGKLKPTNSSKNGPCGAAAFAILGPKEKAKHLKKHELSKVIV